MSELGLQKTDLDTPVLWVDLHLLESNIATLAGYFATAGVNWRPHTKGIKVPAIAHKAITAGAIGITCAKLGEAEAMAAAGIQDILIANQVVGSKKIARLVGLLRRTDVKVAVDSEVNVVELREAALAKSVELGVLVEVDTGQHRAGVAPGRPAVDLSRRVHQTPGLRYLGLVTWEGHTLAIDDPQQKRQAIEKAIRELTDTAELCRAAGLPVPIVSAGGSVTYKVTSFLPGVTEIEAGAAIFSDVQYKSRGVETIPCLYVRTMVTSRPAPDRIIFDAGFKTLPDWAATPSPIGLPGVKCIRMSAEHGIVTLEEPDANVKVGDAFDFVVGYGDSTVFLHDKLYGIRDGIVEVVWTVHGRGETR